MSTTELRTPSDELLLRVADASAALHHLGLREAVWFGSATAADSPARAEIAVELDHQVHDASDHADVLLGVFEEYGPWCDARIAEGLASGQFSGDGRAAFERVVQVTDGNYADRGATMLSAFTAGIDAQREELRAERPGRPAAADGFRLAFDAHTVGCDLAAFAVMGGLLACGKTAGAGCVIAAASMIALAAGC